jgi:hypothetical protein
VPAARGLSNKLVGQTGEYLVCAELGRRGLIATPFAGNVPEFDVLATDEHCRTVPIQVKTSAGDTWPSQIDKWLKIEYDEVSQKQVPRGPVDITNPDLIYVFVALAHGGSCDRFFILAKREAQAAVIKGHSEWMESKNWRRPRKPASMDCRFTIAELAVYEDNWGLIEDRLAAGDSSRASEMAARGRG